MEQERSITIEPYVAAGGQLGEKIELNEPVARRFMKAADLRHDVLVQKGDEMPFSSAVVMGEELALKGIRGPRDLFSTPLSPRPHYEVTRQPDLYVVDIHDRLIDHDIRNKDGSRQLDNYGYYEDEFIRRLNQALKGGLRDSLMREKRELAEEALRIHMGNLIHSGLAVSALYLASILLVGTTPNLFKKFAHEDDYIVKSLYLIGSVASFSWGWGSSIAPLVIVAERIQNLRDKWYRLRKHHLTILKNPREATIPQVPLVSIVSGNFHLLRHGSKLIKKV